MCIVSANNWISYPTFYTFFIYKKYIKKNSSYQEKKTKETKW